MRIVVPSRKRVQSCAHAIRLFHTPTVCVAESEMADYAVLEGCELLSHPDDVKGIGPLRRWILDNVADEMVVMADDDISSVKSLVGAGICYTHPDDVTQIIANAAEIARAAGAPVFGFGQVWSPIMFRPQDPFSFCGWVGCVIGFVGRAARSDTSFVMRHDVDLCMAVLLRQRIVFIDKRFSFVQKRFTNVGGNAHCRNSEQETRELARLKEKWGPWITFHESKQNTNPSVRVQRRQSLTLS